MFISLAPLSFMSAFDLTIVLHVTVSGMLSRSVESLSFSVSAAVSASAPASPSDHAYAYAYALVRLKTSLDVFVLF